MTQTLIRFDSLESIIAYAEDPHNKDSQHLPLAIRDELSINPQYAFDVLDYLLLNTDKSIEQLTAVFLILHECFEQIRYRLDRKESAAQSLLEDLTDFGNEVMGELPPLFRMTINRIIYEAKLPLKFNIDTTDELNNTATPQIMPKLPEMLEMIRREGVYKTAFELFDLFMPHLQQMPVNMQLSLIAELVDSKKSIAHETAILMLLHPDQDVREKVSVLLLSLGEKKRFTPIDLGRLIVLRSWVPNNEREPIDELIVKIKKHGTSAAPYFGDKPSRIVASPIDGAGAGMIVFETKKQKQRIVGGILFKIGVGIKDAWVVNKAPKNYLDDVIEQSQDSGSEFTPITRTTATTIVQHFLHEAVKVSQVPSPQLLELAEAVGGDRWRPGELDWNAKLQRLIESVDYTSEQLINRAKRSQRWFWTKIQTDFWFESGSIVEDAMMQASAIRKEHPEEPLDKVTARCLMPKCIDKWKIIFLLTALQHKAKAKSDDFMDLLSILEALDKDVVFEEIPFLCDFSKRSATSAMQRIQAENR